MYLHGKNIGVKKKIIGELVSPLLNFVCPLADKVGIYILELFKVV